MTTVALGAATTRGQADAGPPRVEPEEPRVRSTAFTGTRHASSDIDRIAHAKVPRGLVVGPGGSGKSVVLDLIRSMARERGLRVVEFAGASDLARLVPSDVLVVDDLPLLDTESLDVIAERAADPASGLVVAARPWPRSPQLAAIARRLERSAPALVLGLAARSDVLAHLNANGFSPSPVCVDRLLAMTGGVTWMVSYLLATHDLRDCDHDSAHNTIQHLLEDQIAHRIAGVSETLRIVLEWVSLGSNPYDAPLNGDGERLVDAIAEGHAEGLLLRNGTMVPVVRAAVRATLPAFRLAEMVAAPSAQDVRVTTRQALAAWSAGDLDGAATFTDGALTARSEVPDDLVDVVAAVWAARGMMATGSEAYAAFTPASHLTGARACIAAIGVGDRPADGDAAADGAALTTLGTALRLLERGLRASLASDAPTSALSDLVRASELYTAARTDHPIVELPAVIATAAAVGAGDLATAQHVIDAALAGGQGGSWAQRRLLLWHAWVSLQRERPAQARESLRQVHALPTSGSMRDRVLQHAVQVTLAHHFADRASLEEAWRGAREHLLHIDVDLYLLLPLASLVEAAARLEDPLLAGHLRRGLAVLESLGEPPLWANHLRWAGVQQGITWGTPDAVRPHARALVEASGHSPVAETMSRAGAVWVSVLAGSVDADEVESAARSLEAIGLAWDGARLAGHGARRATDRRTAARLLACARQLHAAETPAHPGPARSEPEPPPLRAVAARARTAGDGERGAPSAQPESGLLSERERDVARLVLEGKTYVEIGEAMFISPRTVEHHVAHIRRRLSASSRSDLLSKLRQQLALPPSPPGRP